MFTSRYSPFIFIVEATSDLIAFKTSRNFLYFQMHLIVNGKRVKKKKTSVRKCIDNSNPTWNEAFTFNLSQSHIQNSAFEVNSRSVFNSIFILSKNFESIIFHFIRFIWFRRVVNQKILVVVVLDH